MISSARVASFEDNSKRIVVEEEAGLGAFCASLKAGAAAAAGLLEPSPLPSRTLSHAIVSPSS